MVRPCLRAFASAVLDVTSAQSRLHTGWSVPACVPADLNRCLEPFAHGVVRPCLRARIGSIPPSTSPLLKAVSIRGGPSLPARLQASAARRRLKLAHGVVRPCLRARIEHGAYL